MDLIIRFLVIFSLGAMISGTEVSAEGTPSAASSSSSSGGKGLKGLLPSFGKARDQEERELFGKLKDEIKKCALKEYQVREKNCYTAKMKKGKPVLDKKCKRIQRIQSEIECEKDIKGKVPYKSRPQWDAYRAKKVIKDKRDLDKAMGIKPSTDGKGGDGNKSGQANQDGWMKEFE